MESQVKQQHQKACFSPPYASWLALLLIPLAFLLPLIGERIQLAYIGQEHYCCMSYIDHPEVVTQVEHARSLHWLSNLIIGGSIVMALIVLALAIFLLYRYAIPCSQNKVLRNVLKIVVGIAIVSTALAVITAAAYFLLDNNGYYSHRAQAPQNGIYGDFLYKELR